MPPADEYPWTAEGLHRLAEHAASRGVTLALEPMSHFRTHIANTPEQIMRLVALADHPNLGVLLDTYHMIPEVRDFGAAIQTVGDRLWGLHVCENDRGVPGGGLVPWDQVFAALRDITFDGFVLLEAYNSSLSDFCSSWDVPRCLPRRRGVCTPGPGVHAPGPWTDLMACRERDINDL